jgi:putative transposase
MKYDPRKHHRRSIRLPDYDYASPGAYFVTVCVRGGECLLGEIVAGEMRLSPYGRLAHAFWENVPAHFSDDAFTCVSVDAYVTMPNHIHAIIVIDDDTRRGAVAAPSPSPTPTPRRGDDLGRAGAVPAPPGGVDGWGQGGGQGVGVGRGDPGRGDLAPTSRRGDGPGWGDPGRGDPAPTGERTTIVRPTLGQIVGYYKYQTTKMINQMRDMPGLPFWQRNYWEHVIRDDRSLQHIREYIANNPARWEQDQLHPDAPPNPFNRGER